ncbi:MAG: TetR/AcrR family transcriptional regulator [Pseudomonadota bacterium]
MIRVAMDLFWEKGYENVSIMQIADAVGLPRASIYHSFHDKESIYLEALSIYFAEHPSKIAHSFEPSQDATKLIFRMFYGFSSFLSEESKSRGCFGANAIDEHLAADSDLGNRLREIAAAQSKAFKNVITHAKKQGGLVTTRSPAKIARIMNVFIAGLSSASKSGMRELELREICRDFLKSLGFK